MTQPSVVTRRMNVIGIGAGAASFVTAEAASAIADTDVFVVIDKGAEKADLVGDTEAGSTRLGLAGELADRVGATLIPLGTTDPDQLERAVRSL